MVSRRMRPANGMVSRMFPTRSTLTGTTNSGNHTPGSAIFDDMYPWYRGSMITSGSNSPQANATPGVKGDWATLIPASQMTRRANGFWIATFGLYDASVPGVATSVSLDIGFGAAGAETAVLSNLPIGGMSHLIFAFGTYNPFAYFPIQIPAGTRISARLASSTASRNVGLFMGICSIGSYEATNTTLDVLGVSGMRGTTLSGTAKTFQTIATTAKDYSNLIYVPSLFDASTTARQEFHALQISSGSRILSAGTVIADANERFSWFPGGFPIHIPTGVYSPPTGRMAPIPSGTVVSVGRYTANTIGDTFEGVVVGVPVGRS